MLPVATRSFTHIDNYIQKRAPEASYQFGLLCTVDLVVESTQGEFVSRQRHVALRIVSIEPVGSKLISAKSSRKKPALILSLLQFDDICVFK
jgi:hypothetical protein